MNWKRRPYGFNIAEITYFSRAFNIDPLVINILYSRGIKNGDSLSRFFFPGFTHLYDPFLLNDMKKAISRTIKAIKNNEKIVIFGDYDVDGITSTSILKKLFTFFEADVSFEIPLREHGYGLTKDAVKRIKDKYNPSLIITVDNGSNAHDALLEAKKSGIDIIITDHHEILDGHPNAYAFVNPKRRDSLYPFDGLSGAGVAFKFSQALISVSKYPWDKYFWDYVELAAIGTIADMMPLVDENRVICSLGLKKLNTNPSPVFKELSKILKISEINSEAIGFSIAPILNSVGRISNPNLAVPLFDGNPPNPSSLLEMIATNEKRKEMTTIQTAIAEEIIFNNKFHTNPVIVVQGPFHEGIIGIISARITNKYKKPSIVISANGKGSARSYGQFSIINTIERCSDYLKSFGGHQAAAGLSIDLDLVSEFNLAIQSSALKEPFVSLDHFYEYELPILQFPSSLLDDLKLLEPFGQSNPVPVFYSPNTWVDTIDIFGKMDKHAKFHIGDVEAFLFMKGEQFEQMRNDVLMEFLYSPQKRNKFILQDCVTKFHLAKASSQ